MRNRAQKAANPMGKRRRLRLTLRNAAALLTSIWYWQDICKCSQLSRGQLRIPTFHYGRAGRYAPLAALGWHLPSLQVGMLH